MMAGNGTFAKFESNHLQYRRNDIIPKGDRSLLNNRSSAAEAGRNTTSLHSSYYSRATGRQITTSSNGQHLTQNISLSIDDLADMVEKPEIVHEGQMHHKDNDVMNDIESEYIGERDPSPLAKHDFLVSFLVDARGGSMYGCRNSGIKVIIPPKTASQPMRITCRYVKSDNIRYPPVLNDNEGLACRILKVGPTGSKFLGNVQIEVPYVASLKEGQREIVILKCDSVSKNKWVEHHQEEEIIGEPSHDDSTHRGDVDNDTDDVDKMLKDDMNNHCNMSSTSSTAPMSTPSPSPRREDITGSTFGAGSYLTPGAWPGPGPGSHSGPSPLPPGQTSTIPPLHPVSPHHHINQYNRSHLERPQKVVRIFTSSFPQYFAIITRTTQEIYDVGPEQRMIELSSVPNTRINIKAKSILKNVNIGLSAQNVDDDLVEEIMAQGGSVSPIVTIEPRRRKFHKAIKVSIPLPPKCLAKKKHSRGAQINGGDDESVIVTQLSPALKRTGKKGETPQKKPKGNVSISLNSQNTASPKTTPKKSGKETPKQAESEDESSQIETSLRLVCSMSGNHSRAVWEDVTDTTPMTIHLHDPNDVDEENQAETSAMIEYETSSHGTPSRQRAKIRRRPKSSESPRSAKSSSSVSSSPGYVEFTTLVSASFWLVHCPNWMRADMLQLVDQIYKNTNRVPYFCRFHIYARRGILSHVLPEHSTGACANSPKVLTNKSLSSSKSNIQSMSSSSSSSSYSSTSSNAVSSKTPNRSKSASRKSLPVEEYKQLAHLRILCLSEQDRAVHPLELQEDFVEICRTDDFVEIRDKSEIEVRFSGNLVCLDEDEFDLLRSSCVTSSGPDHITELRASLSEDLFSNIDSKKMIFKPFDDNRMGFAVKRKNEKNLFAKGSISFVTATAGDKILYETKLDLSQFM